MRRVLALALTAFALFAHSALAASATCTEEPTNGTVTRAVAGRSYAIHVPADLGATPAPLLISLHGAGSTGAEDESGTGWTAFADAHHFIVAYPAAHTFTDRTGLPDFGRDVWDPYTQSSGDIAFLRQVVADISAHWCIDPRRVFADGWSNGAVMSQRVACDAADLFAAVDSYAGGDPTVWSQAGVPAAQFSGAPCQPSRRIAVSLLAGTEDFTYGGLASNGSLWRDLDRCGSTATHESDPYGSSDSYACADGTAVLVRAVSGQSHLWPTGSAGDDQRSRIWNFLNAHPLP
jgi:polyhydroxybutyrate depolymerase